jgi:hypothetical protein
MNGIKNKYLNLFFEKIFNLEIEFSPEHKSLATFSGTVTLNGETFVANNSKELLFNVRKYQINLLQQFLSEINKNILLTKDKETQNEYLESIGRKNSWHRLKVRELIDEVEKSSSGFVFSNSNFFKLTISGEVLKTGKSGGLQDYMFQFLNEWISLSINTSQTLDEELNNFLSQSKGATIDRGNDQMKTNSNIIVQWNEQSNVLTDIFKQLKTIYNKDNEPLIPNSYEELAVFLQNNFSCFAKTKLATITTQLKNNNSRPKTNRIIEIKQTKD